MPSASSRFSLDDDNDSDNDQPLPWWAEVMSKQATMNIGCIGHVAHGKSTVVKAMSGVKTSRFKKEILLNYSIHLGYANSKIFKCDRCEAPKSYQAFGSFQNDETKCRNCGTLMKLVRHVSFVDCPGHDVLMATMLNGAAIMDAALLLIAANESFPQPQTLEHLSAVEMMQLKHLLVLQNKIDLVTTVAARDQKQSIDAFLEHSTTFGHNTPVIPICAQLECNIDVVLQYICAFPHPERPLHVPSRFVTIRSFDISIPGDGVERLQGGVLGGSVMMGMLRVGDDIEIRPGIVDVIVQQNPTFPQLNDPTHTQRNDAATSPKTSSPLSPQKHYTYRRLFTRVVSLRSENNEMDAAVPGGLIAVGTSLDPSLTRQNKRSGSLCGPPGSLPEVYSEIEVQVFLLTHLVGVKPVKCPPSPGAVLGASSRFLPIFNSFQRVTKLVPEEVLLVNCKTHSTAATVVARKNEIALLRLASPVCCDVRDKLTLSRLCGKTYRLIGWGTIRGGVPVKFV